MEEELNRAMVLRKNGEFNKSTVLLIRLAEIYPFMLPLTMNVHKV